MYINILCYYNNDYCFYNTMVTEKIRFYLLAKVKYLKKTKRLIRSESIVPSCTIITTD